MASPDRPDPRAAEASALTRAHVVPFVVFMSFMLLQLFLEPLLVWNHPIAPWWRRDLSQWIYPLQTLVCAALLLRYRRHYRMDWSWRWSFIAVVCGVLGIAVWLLPTSLHSLWFEHTAVPRWLEWCGVAARKNGFDPEFFSNPVVRAAALALRFLRAVVVVALIEEIFWRGFLMRLVWDWEGNCWSQPFGRAGLRSYAVVTLLFTLAHQPSDWLVAFLYGSLTYLLCVRSKSLGACVLMHAVANLLLGLYIIVTGKNGLW